MNICQSLICCASVMILAVAGCGDGKNQDAIVQGRVTIDGELADQGTVTFHPKEGGPIAYGTIHSDGSFTLQIGQGRVSNLDQSEIYSGEYIATVVINAASVPDKERGEGAPPTPGVRITAVKYANKETSDLLYSVKPGRNVFSIPVEHAEPEEIATDDSQETADQSTSESAAVTSSNDEKDSEQASEANATNTEEALP